ncbi:MAG: cyclopropane fatty acyl phospholipid synthase [Arenicellales bacterium]|nr:cyclopropane fatty acyl phospholipid synthase [Arenicellales bacterium]
MRKTIREFEKMLEPAGIQLNGTNAWDIEVHDKNLFPRLARDGTLGLGEAYMDGWWDCPALDEMIDRAFRAGLEDKVRNNSRFLLYLLSCRLLNHQSRARAFQVGEQHYDIGNDVFESMLDSYMNYSCGYWDSAGDLEQAQIAKMQMICAKLKLEPGMQVLDLGCGWGGLSRWMAERHGVDVTGVTVSKEQAQLARERCVGLPVAIEVKDYRDLDGEFDRIASVGMFEHVGQRNYRTFFQKTYSLLKSEGLFLLHTIGASRGGFATDRWIEKYIFPNGVLPPAQVLAERAGAFFTIEDWHNFGADYDPTLMAWHKRFNAAWPQLKVQYGERFKRMFDYYLLVCAGSFRSRENHLWQVMLAKGRLAGGYRAPRWTMPCG